MVFNIGNFPGLNHASPVASNFVESMALILELGLETGVPQGSYLGLLLFLTYFSDLPQAVRDSVVSMYTVDTNLGY